MDVNTSYAEIVLRIENLRKMRNDFAEETEQMASYTEEDAGPTLYPLIQLYLRVARNQISEMDSEIMKAEAMLKASLDLRDLAEKLSAEAGIDFEE